MRPLPQQPADVEGSLAIESRFVDLWKRTQKSIFNERGKVRIRMKLIAFIISVAQPQQAFDYQSILNCVVESVRQRLVASVIPVLIVNVVVTHVEIEHLVVLV